MPKYSISQVNQCEATRGKKGSGIRCVKTKGHTGKHQGSFVRAGGKRGRHQTVVVEWK